VSASPPSLPPSPPWRTPDGTHDLSAPPPFSLTDIRNAIPAHCWEKNTFKSFAHLALDVGIVAGLAAAAYVANSWWAPWSPLGLQQRRAPQSAARAAPARGCAPPPLHATRRARASAATGVLCRAEVARCCPHTPHVHHAAPRRFVWPLYWLAQGTMFWALFVVGHDCGHQSFSPSRTLNDFVGNIVHASIMVPYHGWRVSHRKHHGVSRARGIGVWRLQRAAAPRAKTETRSSDPPARISLRLPPELPRGRVNRPAAEPRPRGER
jgi:fatty acid desaturase